MESFAAVLLLLVAGPSVAQKNLNALSGRSTIVHLFEWKWDDIADECERFLGPKGYAGVQISPPTENLIVSNRPWWERYQPISYNLTTRSGNEDQLASMVKRCNAVGVRIYADVVLNHMAGSGSDTLGTAGNRAEPNNLKYPQVPYGPLDFNSACDVTNYYDRVNVRNCRLNKLPDLNQGKEYVRDRVVGLLNDLIDVGVAGFRIDSAKHMWPGDLEIIYGRLKNLSTVAGFPTATKPFIYQHVVDLNDGEAVKRSDYVGLGRVTEFRVGKELSNCFRGTNPIKYLKTFGPQWNLMADGDAMAFIDNHDNQRNRYNTGAVLTYKESRAYKMATAFMLSWPYAETRIMSSYEFSNSEQGPPADSTSAIASPVFRSDDSCGGGWVCEHRWRQVYSMVDFRNVVAGTSVTSWWDNGNNQIAFCRGTKGFVAFNVDSYDLDMDLQTCLPAGTYCDVISGSKVGPTCSGKAVVVDGNGVARIQIRTTDSDGVLAIHEQSNILYTPASFVEEESPGSVNTSSEANNSPDVTEGSSTASNTDANDRVSEASTGGSGATNGELSEPADSTGSGTTSEIDNPDAASVDESASGSSGSSNAVETESGLENPTPEDTTNDSTQESIGTGSDNYVVESTSEAVYVEAEAAAAETGSPSENPNTETTDEASYDPTQEPREGVDSYIAVPENNTSITAGTNDSQCDKPGRMTGSRKCLGYLGNSENHRNN